MRYSWLLVVAVCASYTDDVRNTNAAAVVQCQFAGGSIIETRPQTIYLYHFKTRLKYTSQRGSSYNTNRFLTATPPLFVGWSRELSDWEHYRYNGEFEIGSGSLVSDHCIQSTEDISSSIVLAYANRKRTIDISDYQKTQSDNDGIKIIESSSEAILDIGDQTAPDWVDLMQAKIVRAPQKAFLQIQLHNSGEQEARELSLRLLATNSLVRCVSTPQIRQGELIISSKEGVISAASTDLIFGNTRTLNNVEQMLGPCGEKSVTFDLGTLPPIQPRQDFYINYVISALVPEGADGSNNFFNDYSYMELEVTGGSAFPRKIRFDAN